MNSKPRFDIYAQIHKGMRLGLSQCLVALGSMDAQDDTELQPVLDEVGRLLDLCRAHVKHENEFIHTAMERRQPGSTRAIASEHVEHVGDIDALQQEYQRILRLPSLRRAEPASRFYQRFAQFTALNLEHMAHEETDNNAVLWACYSDAELEALDRELVAHVEPAIMQIALGYMVPAMNPVERAAFLGDLRQVMPEEAFTGILGHVEPLLTPTHRSKLQHALALPAANAA
jgi:Hemerythrin HHE cation binding domain